MAFDLSTAKPVSGFNISTARPVDETVDEAPPQDSFVDNTLDVAGEFSAGANRTAMWIPNTLVAGINRIIGGYRGVGELVSGGSIDDAANITKQDVIPDASDVVEMVSGYRPGQGGYMDEGMARQAVSAAGEVLAPGAAGLKSVAGRNLAKPAQAAAEFVGLGRQTAPAASLPAIVEGRLPSPNANVATDLALKRGRGDVSSFGYVLNEAGEKVKDGTQVAAAKAGFQKPVITMVKQTTDAAKAQMRKMITVLEGGMENAAFKIRNRLTDVPGESIIKRFNIVNARRKLAGTEIDAAAKALKGETVEFQSVADDFARGLKEMGVKFGEDFKPIFKDSDVQGFTQIEGLISRVIKRMTDLTGSPDAYNVHQLKRFIDKQINIGKMSQSGVDASVESLLLNLRKGLDSALDGKFKDYDAANTVYAETVGAINALRDAGAKNLNFDSPNASAAFGQLSRRLLGNQQTRIALTDALDGLDVTARKYAPAGTKGLDDALIEQLKFIDELERNFGKDAVSEMSFQGEIAKGAINSGVGGGNIATDAINMGKSLMKKTDKQKLKALKDLLD